MDKTGLQARWRGSASLAWLVMVITLIAGLSVLRTAQAQSAPAAQPPPPSPAVLADLLDHEATRNELIRHLRALAATPAAEGGAATPAASSTPSPDAVVRASGLRLPAEGGEADASFARRIADSTQAFAESLAQDLAETASAVTALWRGDAVRGVSMSTWGSALGRLAVVIVATALAWFLLGMVAARAYVRLDRWVGQSPPWPAAPVAAAPEAEALPGEARPPLPPARPVPFTTTRLYRKLLAIPGGLLIDLAAVFLAGVAGYAVAVFGVGASGGIGTLESLFINAFVAVEVTKALVRVIFAHRYENLRLLAMADDVALYWNRWLARLIWLTGYGTLVAVPILKAMFSPAVGQMVGLIVMLGVYAYAVRVIWRNRALLRERLKRRADQASNTFFGTLFRMLARTWHLLAIAYFTVLLVVSQIAPDDALAFMARATLQTLLAVGVGVLVSTLLTTLMMRRIRLTEDLHTRLPMLEARLNAYVPAVIRGLRLLILISVFLVVLDAWHAFNLSAWLASEQGRGAIAMVVHVSIILLAAMFAWTLIASLIEHRLNTTIGPEGPSAREKTLLALFRNAALIVIVTMTIMVVLSQIGIDVAPLIAGAGVVGLAIGFGAQKLVQDIITGVFIQLENGMNQNDVVEAGGVFGTVEKITLRSVGIRTLDGGYHMIPFSSVDKVTNHMRDFSYHLGEYTVAHRESVDEAMVHLERAFDELKQDEVLAPEIIEDMTIPGVTSLSERGVTIRVLIKTTPGMQWAVQRGFNRLVKKHFDAANIELPYPHSVVYFGQDKNGRANPARVRSVEGVEDVAPGQAPGAGYTPRPLARAPRSGREDVLGNERETVMDDDGNPKVTPA